MLVKKIAAKKKLTREDKQFFKPFKNASQAYIALANNTLLQEHMPRFTQMEQIETYVKEQTERQERQRYRSDDWVT